MWKSINFLFRKYTVLFGGIKGFLAKPYSHSQQYMYAKSD